MLELLSKPVARVCNSVDGAIDLVLESGTRDIESIAIITIKNGDQMAWFYNDISTKELVWLMERCKHEILQNERNARTRA